MLKKIFVCGRCEKLIKEFAACRCGFHGYYTAKAVYGNWIDFLRSRIRLIFKAGG